MTLEQNLRALVQTIANYINTIFLKIGSLTSLQTTNKTDIVSAINEIKTEQFIYRTYTYTNTLEVNIQHDLNTDNFFAKVYDANSNELIVFIEKTDLNNIKIKFPIAMSGKVDIAFKPIS